MNVAVLVPGPWAAGALGELLSALGREPGLDPRVVALGQETAAALPEGLDTFVYPVREGTRIPEPFLAPLLEHLAAEALLAPLGAVDAAPVPALLLDLGEPGGDPPPVPRDPAHQAWTEAVTARPERRRQLVREGLFTVHLLPEWFLEPGRPAAAAAGPVARKLRELAPLAAGAVSRPPADAVMMEETITTPLEPPAPAPPEEEITVQVTSPAPAPPARTAAPPAWEPETHDPERYRDRHAGRGVLVLASPEGLEALSPADLAGHVVVATPGTLGWLISRMGIAHYTCATAEPATVEERGALAGVRAVLVHPSHLDGTRLAPAARALVPLVDLARAGGPVLGWSDEMGTGYFPGPGDAALAVQWAAWLGAGEIRVVGAAPLEADPSWSGFVAGARSILAARGCRLVLRGDGAPAGTGGAGADLPGGLRATLGG